MERAHRSPPHPYATDAESQNCFIETLSLSNRALLKTFVEESIQFCTELNCFDKSSEHIGPRC